MTARLPPPFTMLFEPRPALPYKKPLDKDPAYRPPLKISGVAQYLDVFKAHDQNYIPTESFEENRRKRADVKRAAQEQRLKEAIEKYEPKKDSKATRDPYKTLFIARLHYGVTEQDLEKEFSVFGRIESLRLVKSVNDKSRGYAFVEYERERDMKEALREADGIKILGRRILVDVERGRTVKDWKPRRLGGGRGGRGYTQKEVEMEKARDFGFGRNGRGGGGGGGFRGGGFRGGRPGFGGGRGGRDRDDRRNGGGFNRGPPPSRGYGDDRRNGGGGFRDGGFRDRDGGGGYRDGGGGFRGPPPPQSPRGYDDDRRSSKPWDGLFKKPGGPFKSMS